MTVKNMEIRLIDVLLVIVIALSGWNLRATVSLKEEVAILKTDVKYLRGDYVPRPNQKDISGP